MKSSPCTAEEAIKNTVISLFCCSTPCSCIVVFLLWRQVRQVDKDGSGEIGFKEFLAILQPKGVGAGKSAIDKIVHLQDVKKVNGS